MKAVVSLTYVVSSFKRNMDMLVHLIERPMILTSNIEHIKEKLHRAFEKEALPGSLPWSQLRSWHRIQK
jgi:hypothetical protein